MGIIQNGTVGEEKRGWGHYFKMCALYVTLIAGAFFLYFSANYFVDMYQQKVRAGEVAATAEAMKAARDAEYARAMADTVGGTTPQETLRLYIAAVERGDYETASRYFIASRQAEELESLIKSSKKNIDNVVQLLKQALGSVGSYSSDRTGFAIRKPLLVDFQKYPNGVWKIIEI